MSDTRNSTVSVKAERKYFQREDNMGDILNGEFE